MATSYYSIGTARYDAVAPEAIVVARAVHWLMAKRDPGGTWAGPDKLDEFISTTHSLMALMAVGMPPEAKMIAPAMSYLVTLNKERQLSFFWRSGVFLNLPRYRDIVREDAKYIWSYRDRVAVHRDYPVHFFLLKLLRFGGLESEVDFTSQQVLERILADWNPERGWYDRTSITTMAVSMIYGLQFRNKKEIIEKSVKYVVSKFAAISEKSGKFSENLVDDAFLVFNLYETDFLSTREGRKLAPLAEMVVNRLLEECQEGTFWVSEPPFGGAITNQIYPTAVVVRALLSFFIRRVPEFLMQVAGQLTGEFFGSRQAETSGREYDVRPFWGEIITEVDDDLCFVLMPFSPRKLTEIYERYVKRSVEELGMRCVRADDILLPRAVMRDVWEHINRAAVIIAELTDRNPNVFYELGMAHVRGKEVILVAQSTGSIPFDVHGIRHIIYDDTLSGYEKLAVDIKRSLRAILEDRKNRAKEPVL